ncbi:hypothetical protein [Streptococcus hyointestinalis]|nr:hypothetical protein [Streptococcus hyointestinalis]
MGKHPKKRKRKKLSSEKKVTLMIALINLVIALLSLLEKILEKF